MKNFIAKDSETKKTYLVSCKDVDKATSLLADMKTAQGQDGSDGDEFAIQELLIPKNNKIVEVSNTLDNLG